jgi:signal transduction histidine kinase
MDIETKRSIEEETVFRHLLRVLAEQGSHPRGLQEVLETALRATGAQGGLLMLTEPAHFFAVGSSDWTGSANVLESVFSSLEPGIQVNPPQILELLQDSAMVIAAPLHCDRVSCGGLALFFETAATFADQQETLIASLIDAASAIAERLFVEAKYTRGFRQSLAALNAIADPLVVLDENRWVVLLNPAAEAVFEKTALDAVGQPAHGILQDERLIALLENEQPVSEWSPDGGEHVYEPRLEIARGADGEIEGYVLVLHDLTRYKKLNLNQAQFLRVVSHDLRSPLTSMQGFASMLELSLVGEMNDRQRQFVQKILSGITQITALVDNIQDAGRFDPETGFYEMSRAHCDLNEIVNRIVKSHLVPAEKQLTIGVQVDNDVPIISADSNMLERAITNLFDNAVKYTPDGGAVDVRVQVHDSNVLLSVHDTGFGISPENQKLLFQRHMRIARQEYKKIKGSGLGLFIVRSVAQRHGGDAWVESAEGVGSTFYFSIPLSGQNTVVSG